MGKFRKALFSSYSNITKRQGEGRRAGTCSNSMEKRAQEISRIFSLVTLFWKQQVFKFLLKICFRLKFYTMIRTGIKKKFCQRSPGQWQALYALSKIIHFVLMAFYSTRKHFFKLLKLALLKLNQVPEPLFEMHFKLFFCRQLIGRRTFILYIYKNTSAMLRGKLWKLHLLFIQVCLKQCCGSASKKCGCGCGSWKKSLCGCGCGFMLVLNYGEPSNSIRNL